MDEEAKTRIFEEHRSLLHGIAYRMLGTLADAEDVVQDTYLRLRKSDLKTIRDPRAWLVTTCSRLALDLMKSARVRRESYSGTWLPEPFLETSQAADPAQQLSIDDTVSTALMLALEKLSPAERASFLLHEIFRYSFDEIGQILGKSSAACRKLASRARAAVQSSKPRFPASAEEHQRLLDAFLRAAYSGDLDGLKNLLSESVQLHADGGGKVTTAPRVLLGQKSVAEFFVHVMHTRLASAQTVVELVARRFNGVPGVLIYENHQLVSAMNIAAEGGRIQRIYALRNPDKLAAFGTNSTASTDSIC